MRSPFPRGGGGAGRGGSQRGTGPAILKMLLAGAEFCRIPSPELFLPPHLAYLFVLWRPGPSAGQVPKCHPPCVQISWGAFFFSEGAGRGRC